LAVTKLWKVEFSLGNVLKYVKNPDKTDEELTYSRQDFQALQDVIDYAENESKTHQRYYISGINCNPDKAREEFIITKQAFGKTGGIQAYHGYMSFPKDEPITPDEAHQIGIEYASEVWGKDFEVVVTTHLDREHLHNHFVINSISFVDGHRLHDEKAWVINRHIADRICQEHGLSIIEKPERNIDTQYLTNKDKKGYPTRYNMVKDAIDYCIANSYNFTQFKQQLCSMGYSYDFNMNHTYWTVTPKGYSKPIRLYRLGDDYTNDRIQERIKEHSWEPRTTPFVKHITYSVPKTVDLLRRKGSLYNLYLFYCYKLGYLPERKKNAKNSSRLHYIYREDLMKIDRISDELKLLEEHHIDDTEQLFSFKESVEADIKALTDERAELYKVKRHKDTAGEKRTEVETRISDINTRLKKLRKDVRMCDDIAERSKVIEQNIEIAERDEQLEQTKEVELNERIQ